METNADFEKWWEEHKSSVLLLKEAGNLDFLKIIFENCWISSATCPNADKHRKKK